MDHLYRAAADQFRTDGYWVNAASVLPAATVDAAAAGLLAVRDGQYDTGRPPSPSPWTPGGDLTRLVKIEQPQLASHALQAALRAPGLGEAVGRITGADWVQVWHVQGLIKPSLADGAAGPQVGWHQDWHYWQSPWGPDSELFTVWLALSDVTADSGPVLFVPGSQEWGLLEGGDFFGQNQADLRAALQAHLPVDTPWSEVPGVMAPGGFSLHHKLTLHGSAPNTSGRPRMSLAIHLRTSRSACQPGHPFGHYLDHPDICPIIWQATPETP